MTSRCTCPCCSSLSRFVALLLLTLAACAPADDADQPWPRFATRPVHVQASSELPVQCQLAVAASVAFWRERGVSMDAEVVEPWLPSQIGVPVAGVLTIKPGKPSSHDPLNRHPWAEVIRTLTIGGDIYWAEMTLDTCDLMAILHEVAHGLGLPDNDVRGNLMNRNLAKGGLALTDEQLDHVADDSVGSLLQ
jgi:hypothetical protein